jgi:hypothetical protein
MSTAVAIASVGSVLYVQSNVAVASDTLLVHGHIYTAEGVVPRFAARGSVSITNTGSTQRGVFQAEGVPVLRRIERRRMRPLFASFESNARTDQLPTACGSWFMQ